MKLLPVFKYCNHQNYIFEQVIQFFLRLFRDPVRVPSISNRFPRIRENCHRVPRIRKNCVPKIREIGSLQIHTGYLTFSLKKPGLSVVSSRQNYFKTTDFLQRSSVLEATKKTKVSSLQFYFHDTSQTYLSHESLTNKIPDLLNFHLFNNFTNNWNLDKCGMLVL